MLLTKPPKIEGASIGEKKTHKRKLSGGEDLLKGFLQVHESLAQASIGATPRRYIAFLNTYQQVYHNKKSGIEKRQYHLQVSLRIRVFSHANLWIFNFLLSYEPVDETPVVCKIKMRKTKMTTAFEKKGERALSGDPDYQSVFAIVSVWLTTVHLTNGH